MCGRYARTRSAVELAEHFIASDVTGGPLRPDFNVAPTRPAPVVLERSPPPPDPAGLAVPLEPLEPAGATSPPVSSPTGPDAGVVRQVRLARWGLVPSWARDDKTGARMINARVETVASKPAFRAAAAHRRCLVPADGFYEWTVAEDGKTKQPWYLHPPAGMLALAGLYELWRPRAAQPDPGDQLDHGVNDGGGEDLDEAAVRPGWLWTFTVLTTTATDELGRLHDRSPLLVAPEQWDAWLAPARTDAAAALAPLTSAASGVGRQLQAIPVSTRVNSVRNNGPELLEPVALP